jgi:hypothetical protein
MRGFSSNFKRAFFNSKNQFSFLNSKINQNISKINFSNKSFYTRMINLTNSFTMTAMLNQYRIMATSIGTADTNESEILELNTKLSECYKMLAKILRCADISKLATPSLQTIMPAETHEA